MRARRGSKAKLLALALAPGVALGCAVTFGPGDYTGGALDGGVTDAPPRSDVALDDARALPDGAPAGLRLLVIAGEKDGPETATNDVWLASIDANGDVGPFETLQPALFRGAPVTANVAGGRLFVATRALERSVEHAAIDAGVLLSAWRGQAVDRPPFGGYGQAFSGSSLLAFGGGGEVTDDGGSPQLVWDDAIHVARFEDGGFGALEPSTTRLPFGIKDMTMVSYKSFVYLFGGDAASGDQRSKVYVARLDATAGVGAFEETTRVVNPATSQPYTPSSPVLCVGDGRFVIAGGTGSDIVLSSAIDETDGALGPWRAVTKLPGALRAAGCVMWNDTVHLVGGYGATSRTDRIIRARFAADGTLGEWELSSGEKLPEPRSGIIALTF
ncbi:MAG: hypothetical protein KIS78_01610 [Labilithrix sp.]|nr:hypothetical protein [Labilithrix sp.]MCW5831137.1 hypothetical protein [Labilithrix sp.]